MPTLHTTTAKGPFTEVLPNISEDYDYDLLEPIPSTPKLHTVFEPVPTIYPDQDFELNEQTSTPFSRLFTDAVSATENNLQIVENTKTDPTTFNSTITRNGIVSRHSLKGIFLLAFFLLLAFVLISLNILYFAALHYICISPRPKKRKSISEKETTEMSFFKINSAFIPDKDLETDIDAILLHSTTLPSPMSSQAMLNLTSKRFLNRRTKGTFSAKSLSSLSEDEDFEISNPFHMENFEISNPFHMKTTPEKEAIEMSHFKVNSTFVPDHDLETEIDAILVHSATLPSPMSSQAMLNLTSKRFLDRPTKGTFSAVSLSSLSEDEDFETSNPFHMETTSAQIHSN